MTNPETRRLAAALIAVLCVLSPSAAVADSTSLGELVTQADAAFAQGLDLLETDAGGARVELQRAADSYTDAERSLGAVTPGLRYNRANALLLAGDIAGAIAGYREVLALDPSHDGARTNLAVARSRVQTRVDPDDDAGLALPVRLARAVPAWAVLTGTLTGWVVLCGAVAGAGLGLVRRSAPVIAGSGAVLIVAGAIGAAQLSAGGTTLAVVRDASFAYTGPSTSAYAKAFTEPLSAGVEGTVLDETRPGWVAVRLLDGRRAWLERDAVLLTALPPAADDRPQSTPAAP